MLRHRDSYAVDASRLIEDDIRDVAAVIPRILRDLFQIVETEILRGHKKDVILKETIARGLRRGFQTFQLKRIKHGPRLAVTVSGIVADSLVITAVRLNEVSFCLSSLG